MPEQRITLENNYRGLVKHWVSKGALDNSGYRKGGAGYAVSMLNINPFLAQGLLTPGFQYSDIDSTDAADVTTSVTAFATTVVGGAIAAYGIGADKIYKIIGASTEYNDIVDNTPTTPTWPHTIADAGDTGFVNDALVVDLTIGGNKVRCLLYSYNLLSSGSGAGRLGRFDITNDSDWGAGNSSDTAYSLSNNDVAVGTVSNLFKVDRPMVLGPNGILYIGSGYKVDSLDTTVNDAAISLNVIDIPPTFKIRSLAFYKKFLVIHAEKIILSTTEMRGQTVVFFWDTTSPSFEEPVYTDDETAGALYTDAGELFAFTGSTLFGKLRKWNGQEFEVLTEIASTIPKHGAVEKFRDGMMWGSGASVYRYATVVDGYGRGLWQTDGSSGTISCVKRLYPNNEVLHIAGNNYIRKTNTTKRMDSANYSFPLRELPHRSTINQIIAYFLPLATGDDMMLRYLKNFSTTYNNHAPVSFGTSIQGSFTTADGAVSYKVFTDVVQDVNQIQFNLIWAGTNPASQVALSRIDIDYISGS